MVCPLRRIIGKIKRARRRVRRIVKPPKKYRVTVEIENCHEVPGGFIYARRSVKGKWRKVAVFGLRRGSCCAPAEFELEEGLWWLRANCGRPVEVMVFEPRRLRIKAAGCFGSTDNLAETLKRVAIVHIIHHTPALFGVDSRNYVYSVHGETTIFLPPGKHTLYFNTGGKFDIEVKKGEDLALWLPSL